MLFEESHPSDLNAHRHLLVIDLDQEGVRLQDVFMERARMEPMSRGLLDLDAHPDYLSLSASLRYDVGTLEGESGTAAIAAQRDGSDPLVGWKLL